MLHWIALLPGVPSPLEGASGAQPMRDRTPVEQPCALGALDALHLGWWALQFTPRVALLDGAVVLEVHASERLFGGAQVLRQRIITEAVHGLVPVQPGHEAPQLNAVDAAMAHAAHPPGISGWAFASTALAAVALARHTGLFTVRDGADDGAHDDADELPDPALLPRRLDPLPLRALPGVAAHQSTLARLGCQTLAQVRQLPRGGLSRRFGAPLLQTLDQAYGLRPEAFDWLTLPPVFNAQLELPGRVESAPALLFAANRLLQQLCAWLAGRHAGVTAFTLTWLHDGQRRDASREGAWTVRLASPSRDMARLSRLLAEHLQRIQLVAPVGHLALHADAIDALPLSSLNLFNEHGADQLSAAPDALATPAAQRAQREALLTLLEKLSVRLGAQRVLQGQLQADHRLECAQAWQAAMPPTQAHPFDKAAPDPLRQDAPQPCWVLPEPLPLALADGGRSEWPLYQGRLQLLAGPHRIEAGWWDTASGHPPVARDYYLASSEHAGLLWIFKARHAATSPHSPWYLHGLFA